MRCFQFPMVAIAALGALSLISACEESGTATNDAQSGSTSAEASGSSDSDIGEVLATVNAMQVGSVDFEQAASRKQPAEGESLSIDEKKEVLDKLIDEKLLYEAALNEGLDRDPKVMKVMVNTLLREEVYSNVRNSDFTDEELQVYYEAHKDEFVVPEKVQIKRILVKINDERSEDEALTKATEVRAEVVANPKRFKEIAAKHSEDPYRRRGGDVGFVPKSGKPGLAGDIVDKAFEMSVEEVSQPFKTSEGYNVIYIAAKRDRVERTFQQMKGSVLRKVKNERLKSMYEGYVANLRTGAKIDVDTVKLDGIDIKAARRPVGPGFALDPHAGAGAKEAAHPGAGAGVLPTLDAKATPATKTEPVVPAQ